MGLAGEVQPCPDMPVWCDDSTREPGVQTVYDVSLSVNDGVLKVRLDLAQEGGTDFGGYIQLLLFSDAIFLKERRSGGHSVCACHTIFSIINCHS